MKIAKINDDIFHVTTETQKQLGEIFIRFQEHYESPLFRNDIFTLGEYKEWYASEYGNGAFTYYDDWSGFNVPGYVLDRFRCGLFDPLTEKEKELLESIPYRVSPYYIIGTPDGIQLSIVEHEIFHALYYTNESYREKVDILLSKNIDELNALRCFLRTQGYHEDVILDECHAYIAANPDYLKNKEIHFPNITNKIKKLRESICSL